MTAQAKYKTEPMKLWNKVKEFKTKHFTDYFYYEIYIK